MSPARACSAALAAALLCLVVAPLLVSAHASSVWTSIRLEEGGGHRARHTATDLAVSRGKAGVPSKYYIDLHNFKNTMYYAEIDVGTPPQSFRVTFASGSADTWLPSTSCADEACAEHMLFNSSASSSYKHIDDHFNLTYTPGMILGSTGSDAFSVGGCVVENAPFGAISRAARSMQAKYRWFPFDGIIGLSFPGASVSGQTPFFDLLVERQLVQEQIFSLYLTQQPGAPGSTLLLGGTDPKFHLDELTFFPVEPPYVFWMISISRVSLRESALSAASALDRKTLLSICDDHASTAASDKGGKATSTDHSCKAVIDSGTSMISGPSEAVNKLSASLKVDPACRNLDQLPVLSFQFYGNSYPLYPDDYVIKINVRDTLACFLALQAYDFPAQMGPMWVLGNTFLRKYYTVFDRKNKQIGFAVARPR